MAEKYGFFNANKTVMEAMTEHMMHQTFLVFLSG